MGRYELLVPVGSGGMATVYLARARGPEGFERLVALKLLHPHLRDDAQRSRELMDEARIAARIRHANVAQVLDMGDDPSGIFLAMEYVEGMTLAGLKRAAAATEEPLPLSIGLRVLCDALAGLHAAHELRDAAGEPLGVVHRDFSPQNILVGVDGQSRLTDFGIAKAAGRLAHTNTGLVKGKVGYMSPEQVRAHPIDRRTDVWAAGVIVWELFARRRLFPGDDVSTLLKIVSDNIPRLRDLDADAPEALDQAVAEALAVDPEKRIPTAEALRRRLLAAWLDVGAVPDSVEVAEYVSRLGAEQLATRREDIQAVLEERGGETTRRLAASFAEQDADEPVTEAATVVHARELAESARLSAAVRRRRWLAVGGVLLVGGTAVALELRTRAGSPPHAAVSAVVPPPVATAHDLDLAADAPIGQIRVGQRVIAIAPPAASVTIRLGAGEPHRFTAIAADGRRAELEAASGQRRIDVRFPQAPAASAPLAPSASAAPAPKKHKAPRHARRVAAPAPPPYHPAPLAPSPYAKQK